MDYKWVIFWPWDQKGYKWIGSAEGSSEENLAHFGEENDERAVTRQEQKSVLPLKSTLFTIAAVAPLEFSV